MTQLLTQNSKMKKSGGDSLRIFNFGIPALMSADGETICKLAGLCAEGCYAQMGSYLWSTTQAAYEARLAATKRDDFVDVMSSTVEAKLKTASKRNQKLAIRIHDSGDYYSAAYLSKWIEVMRQFEGVTFYSYTKMIPLMRLMRKASKLPDNFVVVFSEGGKCDDQIDTSKDRHCRVFASREELLAAGYVDASEDDSVAFLSDNHRIGLVYHGYSSKQWTTSTEGVK